MMVGVVIAALKKICHFIIALISELFTNSSTISSSCLVSSLKTKSTTHTNQECSLSHCTVSYSNCHCLISKIDALRTLTTSMSPTIIVLCETWLNASVSDTELFISNYYLIRQDRTRHGGGYYFIFVWTSPCYLFIITTFELLLVEIKLQQGPLLLALHYHPHSSVHSLDLFTSLALPQLHSAFLLGDFNIKLLSQNQVSTDLIAMLSTLHSLTLLMSPPEFHPFD